MLEARKEILRRHAIIHDDKQNTHDLVVHSNASKTALNFKNRYFSKKTSAQINSLISTTLKEILNALASRAIPDITSRIPKGDLPSVFEGVLKQIIVHDDHYMRSESKSIFHSKQKGNAVFWDSEYFTDVVWWKNIFSTSQTYKDTSGVQLPVLVALVWMAIHDVENSSYKTETDIKNAENAFFNAMFKLQREYYKEDAGPDSAACLGGAFNDFANLLIRAHPDVVSGGISPLTLGQVFIDFYINQINELPSGEKIRKVKEWVDKGEVTSDFIQEHKAAFEKFIAADKEAKRISDKDITPIFEMGLSFDLYSLKSYIYDVISEMRLDDSSCLRNVISNFYLQKLNALTEREKTQLSESALSQTIVKKGDKYPQPRIPLEFVEKHEEEFLEWLGDTRKDVATGQPITGDEVDLCFKFCFLLSNNSELKRFVDNNKPKSLPSTPILSVPMDTSAEGKDEKKTAPVGEGRQFALFAPAPQTATAALLDIAPKLP